MIVAGRQNTVGKSERLQKLKNTASWIRLFRRISSEFQFTRGKYGFVVGPAIFFGTHTLIHTHTCIRSTHVRFDTSD